MVKVAASYKLLSMFLQHQQLEVITSLPKISRQEKEDMFRSKGWPKINGPFCHCRSTGHFFGSKWRRRKRCTCQIFGKSTFGARDEAKSPLITEESDGTEKWVDWFMLGGAESSSDRRRYWVRSPKIGAGCRLKPVEALHDLDSWIFEYRSPQFYTKYICKYFRRFPKNKIRRNDWRKQLWQSGLSQNWNHQKENSQATTGHHDVLPFADFGIILGWFASDFNSLLVQFLDIPIVIVMIFEPSVGPKPLRPQLCCPCSSSWRSPPILPWGNRMIALSMWHLPDCQALQWLTFHSEAGPTHKPSYHNNMFYDCFVVHWDLKLWVVDPKDVACQGAAGPGTQTK